MSSCACKEWSCKCLFKCDWCEWTEVYYTGTLNKVAEHCYNAHGSMCYSPLKQTAVIMPQGNPVSVTESGEPTRAPILIYFIWQRIEC